jgi:transposase InsO family protein
MPAAIPLPIRQAVAERHHKGQSLAALAEALHLPFTTVRRLWRRYRDHGDPGLTPDYARCGRHPTRARRHLRRAAVWLKRRHPGWGAQVIRLVLQRRWPHRRAPSAHALQRWFRQAGVHRPRRRGRPPQHPVARAGRAHEVWQVDAVEKVQLASGEGVCWLTAEDEYSGAVLRIALFAGGQWNQVKPAAVQKALRRCFRMWGLPGAVRVDNGYPWGSGNDLPTALALWLIGLGVPVHWNRPRRPQDNGKVERLQGVTQQWAEAAQCPDRHHLRVRLTWVSTMQRERYPAVRGQSRRVAYPELGVRRRPYDPCDEARCWDVGRVYGYLSHEVWPRRVDANGRVSLYCRAYTVGRRYARQQVHVRFDAAGLAWVFSDSRGQEIRRYPAEQLTAERIRSLQVSDHKRLRSRNRGPNLRRKSGAQLDVA